ncbi:MAG: response regulator [SAR324 cluster bacterium]|nr:response regulator [SAR324 cluster bacterium]
MIKILVIDDTASNLTLISMMLKGLIEDSIVVTSQNPKEGIKKAQEELPDTILLDIAMPEMDGYEVCENLKSNTATQHIPIIMMTAVHLDSNSRIKGLDIGADAFLAQPIDEAELAAQIKAMLRIKKAEDLLRAEKDLLKELVEEKVKAQQQSEEKYRNVMEYASDGIFIFDSQGQHLDVNQKGCDMTGYSRSEILNMHTEDIIQGKELDQEPLPFDPLLKGKHLVIECQLKHKERKVVIAEISSKKLPDGRILGIVRDITEKKKAEENQEQLEQQLRQAQKLEAIGTLAGGIAHDFNNILQGIIASVQLAKMKIPPMTEEAENLERAFGYCRRGANLVRQILTFSRQTEHQQSVINIVSVIKEVLKMIRSTMPATVEIQQNIPTTCSNISGSLTQIHQVFMNLCTNAEYAMRETGGVLKVQLDEIILGQQEAAAISSEEKELTGGKYLKLSISDTGVGMSQKVQEHIFEPFFTTKPQDEGTGLGLSVVHGIVHNHQGAIRVESQIGQGTKFELFFPTIPEVVKEHKPKALSTWTGNERILLVDDEEPVVDMMKTILSGMGYKVTCFYRGKDALEAFFNAPDSFDLVISDQTMPNMTGEQMAQALLEARPNLPIILMTGFSHIMSQEKAISLGVKHLLLKPIEMDQIGAAIRDALKTK